MDQKEVISTARNDKQQEPSLSRQFLGGLQGWTTGIMLGLATSFVSVGMDSFQKESLKGNTLFHVTNSDIGVFGSAISLGNVFGAICSGFITRRFGRKIPCIVTLLPYLAGWMMIAFPTSFTMMVIGQGISGFAQGVRAPISRMYLAELAHPKYRGQFLSGVFAAMQVAMLGIYLAGLLLNWQQLAIVCGVAPVLLIPLLLKVPESQVWLVTRGRTEEARNSLQWFYGDHYNIDLSFQEVTSHHNDAKEAINNWKDIFRLDYLKPVIIMAIFVFLRNFCGGTPVQYFTSQVLRESSTTALDPKYGLLIIGFVQLVALFTAGLLMDIIGRRKSIMVSGIWMGLAQAALGAYFYIDEDPGRREVLKTVTWLPIVLLSLSMIGFNLGILPLFFVLVGEVIPIQIKDQANALVNVINNASVFISLRLFHYSLAVIGASSLFWVYSGCCFLLVFFMTTALPETKGKTLGDIERKLTDLGSSNDK